jgi:ABC-type glycerol-3-phosphate transport system permease component
MTTNHANRRLLWIGFAIVVTTTAIAIIYPFYWMVTASFAPEGSSLSRVSLVIPPSFSLNAYVNLFARKPMALWLLNTFLVTAFSSGIAVPLALLAAYSLNRYRFRGRTGFIFFVLLAQLLPVTSVVIPLFLIFRSYRLLDTLPGITIAYMTFMLPLAIWILWGYLQGIPVDFEEAALVDGCNRAQAFIRVTLPLALPGVAATLMYCFLEGWNQYFLAYVLTSNEDKWVVSLGLFSFIGEYSVEIEQMMAASVVAALPALVVFVILQRFLRGGLSLGGLRG